MKARDALDSDAASIATLLEQLGYRASEQLVREKIGLLGASPMDATRQTKPPTAGARRNLHYRVQPPVPQDGRDAGCSTVCTNFSAISPSHPLPFSRIPS